MFLLKKNSKITVENFKLLIFLVKFILLRKFQGKKNGDLWGTRTPVTGVKGRCPNH